MQAEAAPLLERSASQKARLWTIATPLLLTAGALAGTSAGCLATLSGIGGPPLILMYELLAVPKVTPCPASGQGLSSYAWAVPTSGRVIFHVLSWEHIKTPHLMASYRKHHVLKVQQTYCTCEPDVLSKSTHIADGTEGRPVLRLQQVVRATQTTMGLVSVKFFTYLLLGAGSWSNLPLYGMAIVCSLIGLNIGNAISKRMDQRMFSNLLLGIMLLSTALLYAASYGLTGR